MANRRPLRGAFLIPPLQGAVVTSPGAAVAIAEDIGYPVVLKAVHGGGGRGIEIVRKPTRLEDTFLRMGAEARSAFGSSDLYLEKCQGRSKIRPRWRRKTRPPGRWAECLSAVVRTGWSGVWDRPWGGLRRSGNPCAQPAPSWGGGVRAPGRPRGGGPSCCVRGGSCRR